jgi:predicted transcriptional regulator
MIHIIRDPQVMRLLSSATRSEILRLLTEKTMTGTQISKRLGVTTSAICYHLNLMEEKGLVEITRFRQKKHGIAKYYSTTAPLFIIDPNYMPKDVQRYFLKTHRILLEGVLLLLRLQKKSLKISSSNLENFTKLLLKQLVIVAKKSNQENLDYKDVNAKEIIYVEALNNLLRIEDI